jgi:hypothetical protein
MKTKFKLTNPEQLARDKRFEIFEEVLRLVPSNPSKRKCSAYRDHLRNYKSGGAELQFDSGYHKNELPEDYHSIWLPLAIDPYQGGVAVGSGPTFPRLSCHKSSNVNLEWLLALAAEWALQGNCYQEVEQ